jgi:hypothetical protein
VAQPPDAEFDPGALLDVLGAHDVDFVLVGGLAGIAHGSAYNTFDLDIVYARDALNLERLVASLRELGASLRGAPAGLPLQLDAVTLRSGMNFTFTTSFGPLDILGDAAGAPAYHELRAASTEAEIRGRTVRVASLDHLIAMKEAAGRPKDKLMATEYRVLSDELRAPPRPSPDDPT